MRLSPVLITVLAASTNLFLVNSAYGQALYYSASSPDVSSPEISSSEIATPETGATKQGGTSSVSDLPPYSVPVISVAAPESIDRPLASSDASPSQGVKDTKHRSISRSLEIDIVVPTTTVAQSSSPDPVSQSPALPSQEAPPPSGVPQQSPPGTQTPTQETPNQLQIDTTPAPAQIEFQTPTPTPPPVQPPTTPPAPTTSGPEPRVLVGEVLVNGVEGDLQNLVYQTIRTRPGRTATRSELQEDINAIFGTGFFSNVQATPEDTPLGVRVTFVVTPNPVLKAVRVEGNQVLPQKVVDDIFKDQYGTTLNLKQFQEGVKQVNKWYQDNGYVLAQVLDAPQVSPDGTATLAVAEGIVEGIQVRFLNKEGETTNAQGQPILGRTREFIVTREFDLKPGDVFNRNAAERDLQRVFGLGLFEDVRLSLNPGQDPRKVVVVANVIERNTGSLAAGFGISSASGLFGTVSYQEQNLGGNNQKLGAELQVGEREVLFDLNFTDPWIGGDPFRTSYTVNLFNRRSLSLVFDGGPNVVNLPNGDQPRVDRLGTSLNFTRPLANGWVASAGIQYQRISIRDFGRNISPVDRLGNALSFSGTGTDDLTTLQFGAVRDLRDDPLRPTSGSLLRVGTEQSIPIGSGNIFLNRIRGSYSYYIPVTYTNFSPGPQALAFNVQAGTVFGDLPPYEAFALGGATSVRGYEDGSVGSGRSFIQATAEYRFPIFSVIGGALFVDAATDLGTASSVLGNPAGARNKPGSGYGYGLGVRIQSPLGPIRIDYGINDQGSSRINFGIGERF